MLFIVTLTWVFIVNTIFVQACDDWQLGLLKIEDKNNNTIIPYHTFGNLEAKIAGAFDYNNRLESLFDGRNGALFLWRYEKSIAYYFPRDVWYADSINFTDYVKENTLEDLYERRSEAFKCRPPAIPQFFSKRLADALRYIIKGYSFKCQGFSTIIWITQIATNLFLTSLSGIEKLIGEILWAPSAIDLESLLGLFQGLGDIFEHFDGLIDDLSARNVTLDFGQIVNASSQSGFDALRVIIEVFNSYSINLNNLTKTLNNQYSFFVLVRKLGGDKNGGCRRNQLNSFIYTLVDVMSVIKNELSLSNLRETLRIFYETISKYEVVDIEEQWRTAVRNLLRTIRRLRLQRTFRNLVQLLQDILDEEWHYKGVNMSMISSFLLGLKEADEDTSLENISKYFLKNVDKGTDGDFGEDN